MPCYECFNCLLSSSVFLSWSLTFFHKQITCKIHQSTLTIVNLYRTYRTCNPAFVVGVFASMFGFLAEHFHPGWFTSVCSVFYFRGWYLFAIVGLPLHNYNTVTNQLSRRCVFSPTAVADWFVCRQLKRGVI